MPTPLLLFVCLCLIAILYLLSISDEEIIDKEEEYREKMLQSEKEIEEVKKEIAQKKAALARKKVKIRQEYRAFLKRFKSNK